MNSISIQTRMILLVGALLAMICLASTANLIGRHEGQAKLHALHEQRVEPLGRMLELQALYAVKVPTHLRANDEAGVQALAARGREQWQTLTREIAAQGLALPRELVAQWSAVDQALSSPPAAVEARLAPLEALADQMSRWAASTLKQTQADDDLAVQAFQSALIRNLLLLGLTLALAVWLACLQIRAICPPIRRAASLAAAVANGQLDLAIEAQGPLETRQLLQSLAQMAASLRTIVSEVRDSSESLAMGSAEIANGNADLSRRTESQASSLQQTAASMEQLSATVLHNADAAQRADGLASAATGLVQNGHERVLQMGRTMNDIAGASTRIADIIGTIDAIAFQTNILALNAAVEATRAGEQGRGFAVVASEVRNLAGRAAGAAKEVRQLIQSSQSSVDAGTKQAGEAVQSMAGIVEQMQRVGTLIGEISVGSREQAKGISEIESAVAQLDEVTQQNAALVEESAAATESLRGQARQLTELVAHFRLNGAA